MTNILLEGYDIDSHGLYGELKNFIKPNCKVVIVALAFRDSEVKCLSDWNRLYAKGYGLHYEKLVKGFNAYGVSEDNVSFVNYFSDTQEAAMSKIKNADVVYFTGGLPDRMMHRIHELGIYDALLNFDKVVMGYSAGALVQLGEYHLSPDEDYKEFSFYNGIPYLNDFYLEVHYENLEVQNEAIKRVLEERGKTVYATFIGNGAIIVHYGIIKLIGKTQSYLP